LKIRRPRKSGKAVEKPTKPQDEAMEKVCGSTPRRGAQVAYEKNEISAGKEKKQRAPGEDYRSKGRQGSVKRKINTAQIFLEQAWKKKKSGGGDSPAHTFAQKQPIGKSNRSWGNKRIHWWLHATKESSKHGGGGGKREVAEGKHPIGGKDLRKGAKQVD